MRTSPTVQDGAASRTRWPGVVYGDVVVDHDTGAWPFAGQQLLRELAGGRNRFALIASETSADVDELTNRLEAELSLQVVRLGLVLAKMSHPPTATDIELACSGSTVITDLDVLMWSALHVSVVDLLSKLARRKPTIAVWPGVISHSRARYSTPGRPDHQDILLHDVIVLRPRNTEFPDEVPFTMDRTLR